MRRILKAAPWLALPLVACACVSQAKYDELLKHANQAHADLLRVGTDALG